MKLEISDSQEYSALSIKEEEVKQGAEKRQSVFDFSDSDDDDDFVIPGTPVKRGASEEKATDSSDEFAELGRSPQLGKVAQVAPDADPDVQTPSVHVSDEMSETDSDLDFDIPALIKEAAQQAKDQKEKKSPEAKRETAPGEETESSSIPMRRNVSVSERSAPSSPQMPTQIPAL